MTTAIRIGDTVAMFTVLREIREGKRLFFLCRCECGTEKNVRSGSLGRDIVSCGCKKRSHLIRINLKHGKCGHPVYAVWEGMIQRCHNPKFKQYYDYGGRGIFVCEEWRKDFQSFLNHIGERPAGMTIERIDNDRGYEPGNVRWATRREQMLNTRRSRRKAA